MKLTIERNGNKYNFELIQTGKDSVNLQCNEFSILNISPKGLYRFQNVCIDGIPVNYLGQIELKTTVDDRDQFKEKGTRDVRLKLVQENTTLYIKAYHESNNTDYETICYVNGDGLYLWMDDHKANCYASSKHGTILLIEEV